ncbi:NAD-dependent epimerase/dehydratase family protein [Hymenobacter metallilatus]|uniref:NAD(P)-dependent oxidoreductase n=1 Tax=Hymenobacter metallilatus TaxID=2493666 RepID=A0A3R9NU05_9BACT|nr:NAD(P)-dependent oxidoreductase [Hymenobacter metallilatus]RSK37574.1 NAD(P)-dependent oxidoreductase [Hymenobacter metallilatus]
MRIVVTGSSGRIGQEIVRQLQPTHQVTGLDIRPGPTTHVCGNLTDQALVTRLLTGTEAVIHTAALHAPHIDKYSKSDFVEVNVRGTLHLLEAAVTQGVQRLVLTSSTSVYGHALETPGAATWVTEELTPRPRDIYDITKLAAEELCRHFAATTHLQTRVLRTSRFWEEPWPDRAVYRLYRGLDVRDAARAHVLAVENGQLAFGLYNISARPDFVAPEAAELYTNAAAVVARHYPQAAAVFARRSWPLPSCIDRVYCIDKAQAELHYQPEYNFAELLATL